MPPSGNAFLSPASTIFGTIFIAGGINAILRPDHALSFFELSSTGSDRTLFEALMIVYGIRDVFMGVAMYIAAYYRHKKILGAVVIAGAAVAWVDGAVCKWVVGKGEWGHWGHAPMLAAVGAVLMGALD